MSESARDGDDYDAFVHPTPHRQPENRLSIDPATGHLCLAGPATDDELSFLDAIAMTRTLYPLAPEDVAWSPDQQCDADGRTLSIIEMDQLRGDA